MKDSEGKPTIQTGNPVPATAEQLHEMEMRKDEAEAARREADHAAFAEACDHLFYTLRRPQDYQTSIAFEAQKETFRLAVADLFRVVAAARGPL